MHAVTPLYAGVSGLFFLVLSARVIQARGRAKVSLGLGEDPALHRAVRVHGNFAEYVPLTLLLMLAVEVMGVAHWILHLAGLGMLLGRLAHALSIGRATHDHRLRVAGMVLTFASITVLSLAAIAFSLL
ncbi:MAPEG family protein [Roseomonas sp. WA12]